MYVQMDVVLTVSFNKWGLFKYLDGGTKRYDDFLNPAGQTNKQKRQYQLEGLGKKKEKPSKTKERKKKKKIINEW